MFKLMLGYFIEIVPFQAHQTTQEIALPWSLENHRRKNFQFRKLSFSPLKKPYKKRRLKKTSPSTTWVFASKKLLLLTTFPKKNTHPPFFFLSQGH